MITEEKTEREIFTSTVYLADLSKIYAGGIASSFIITNSILNLLTTLGNERDNAREEAAKNYPSDSLDHQMKRLVASMTNDSELEVMTSTVYFNFTSIFLRIIDAYEHYTKRIMTMYVMTYPETMKPNKSSDKDKEFSVPVSRIIEERYASLDHLRNVIIGDFVNSVSAGTPYINTITFIEKKSGSKGKLYSGEDLKILKALFSLRNSFTHEISKYEKSDVTLLSKHFKFNGLDDRPIDPLTIVGVGSYLIKLGVKIENFLISKNVWNMYDFTSSKEDLVLIINAAVRASERASGTPLEWRFKL